MVLSNWRLCHAKSGEGELGQPAPLHNDCSDDDVDLYIKCRKVLFVCVSRKMITLPTSLKSSSLAVFMVIHGSRLVFHGSRLVFMVFQSFRLVFHGSRSVFHGSRSDFMGFHGARMVFQGSRSGFHGSRLVFMVFYGSRLVSHGSNRKVLFVCLSRKMSTLSNCLK